MNFSTKSSLPEGGDLNKNSEALLREQLCGIGGICIPVDSSLFHFLNPW